MYDSATSHFLVYFVSDTRKEGRMSLGKKKKVRQQSLWIPQHKVARSPGHPFYKRLNAVLAEEGFDEWA